MSDDWTHGYLYCDGATLRSWLLDRFPNRTDDLIAFRDRERPFVVLREVGGIEQPIAQMVGYVRAYGQDGQPIAGRKDVLVLLSVRLSWGEQVRDQILAGVPGAVVRQSTRTQVVGLYPDHARRVIPYVAGLVESRPGAASKPAADSRAHPQ